jgi:hypothetical protein
MTIINCKLTQLLVIVNSQDSHQVLLLKYSGYGRYGTRVADPQNFNEDPDQAFLFNADPYPAFHFGGSGSGNSSSLSDGSLRTFIYRPSTAPFSAFRPPL